MDFLKEWSGVIVMVIFAFWVGYNVYQNWHNKKEKENQNATDEQEDEFDLIKKNIKEIENRLRVVEILYTVPQKPETHYDPSKGITILSKKED